ncbi:Cytochrome P450 [Cordyceps militaris CM01]|uniref:Cytochrome P450 n=1 Tax=Cordyceps militaris (strain CM01) TaxID=983644 RepID=G3J712_CORMM|nr:Cytochrome P450 [Cordyceps militaris CM01]EGX97085.1 Cytochrome P450 [Cordyceps militaris CM01]
MGARRSYKVNHLEPLYEVPLNTPCCFPAVMSRALPKPVLGISCNEESSGRLLGEASNLVAAIKRHGDVFSIPFGNPVVILADAHETRDILVNKTARPGAIPNAGPSNSFGMGLRSCFGKGLAYMRICLLLVSAIWNFELMGCPDELSSNFGKFDVVCKPQQTYVRGGVVGA